MKKSIWFVLLILFSSYAFAQSTSVTATITDTDGQVWAYGTAIATFVPGPTSAYRWSGGSIPNQVTASMDGTGTFTMSIPDNTTITPVGSAWRFSICPDASSPCVSKQITVAGSSMNLSTQLSSVAQAPRFPATPWAYGYSDAEIQPKPVPGGMYWNVISSENRCWNGSSWITCSGSASFPTGTTDQLLYYATSGTTLTPLTLGTNLSITSGTLNETGGTVSGQANGVIPLATGSTTIEAQSHLSDNGTQITASEPISGTAASFNGAVSTAETNTVYNAASCGYTSAPSWCSGSDIGAWVNAAITAGASTVFIPSGSYTFSTPISVTVTSANSNLQLVCANKGVTLNYTGSSEALLIDDASGSTAMNMGIENCSFNGSGAQASTDGIELMTTGPISLSHVSVTSFPGDGIYMQGALEASLFDVRVGTSGAYNLHLAPDTATGISTNAMHMFGGSLYYGGLANFWDAGNGTYQDQNNTLIGVTEEMTTWTPQNIVEDTANDAIQDGYIVPPLFNITYPVLHL